MSDAEIPTPAQVATNEAARQAVMLVFGVVTAMIVMKLQSKMVRQMMSTAMPGSAAAADEARTKRMSEAKRLERNWSKVAGWFSDVAVWASRQANEARAQYERERA